MEWDRSAELLRRKKGQAGVCGPRLLCWSKLTHELLVVKETTEGAIIKKRSENLLVSRLPLVCRKANHL